MLGQVAGRGDGKLADGAAKPNGYYFLFQQFAQPDSEIKPMRNDVGDGVADRNIEDDIRVSVMKVRQDRLKVIDIGGARSNDAHGA